MIKIRDFAAGLRTLFAGAPSAGHSRLLALAAVQGAVALALIVATFPLSASTGAVRVLPPSRMSRADLAHGFSPAELTRISTGLSPYAAFTAERLDKGEQGWTPTGLVGWGVYDLSPPTLIHRQLSYDEARAFNDLIQPTSAPVSPMKPFTVTRGTPDYNRALECLTQAIYYEAGNEAPEGQEAVAQVVLNRVRHPAYPKTVCGVVYQGSQLATGCQFSFTCDGSLTRLPNADSWLRAHFIATQALNGFVYGPIGTATHYHADYVFPYWAVTLVKLKQIGAHIFYRMTGPSGAADDFDGRYAGNEAIISPAVLTGGDTLTPDAPSAVIPAVVFTPQPKLVSLTIGGVTRTYAVGPNGLGPPPTPTAADVAANASSNAAPNTSAAIAPVAPIGPAGVLSPIHRAPTAAEIAEINQKVQEKQKQQAAAAEAADRLAPPKF